MISVPAIFDELDKIAESMPLGYEHFESPSQVPPEDRRIDKDKLKRFLRVAAVTGVGAAIGAGTGKLIGKHIMKIPNDKVGPYLKYGPAAVGALGALTAKLLDERRQLANRYIVGKKSA